MKKNIFLKVMCLIMTMLMVIPIMPGSLAEAASNRSSQYWNLNTEGNTGNYWSYRTLNVETYYNGNKADEDVELTYRNSGWFSDGVNPGDIRVTSTDNYVLDQVELWNGSSKEDYSSTGEINDVTIEDDSTKTLKIYVKDVVPKLLMENEYLAITNTKDIGENSKTLYVNTYVNGTDKKIGATQEFEFIQNEIGLFTVTPKGEYEIYEIETRNGSSGGWSAFTSGSIMTFGSSNSKTVNVYLVGPSTNVIQNDYWNMETTKNIAYYDGNRTLNVITYLDDVQVGSTVTAKYSESPGASEVTAKGEYSIVSMKLGSSNFSTGNDISISNGSSKTLKIYLTSPKKLNVNYYFDDVLQDKLSTSTNKAVGEAVNINLEAVDGKVFQKAKISDDSIARSINTATKEISFVMPNYDVTISYYYGSEGQVILNKTATPVPDKINEFNIDISVEGTPIVTRRAADIVLVFDKSGSMDYDLDYESAPSNGRPSRMDVLKDAADTFINKVLPANEISLNQISIVTYSGSTGDGVWNDASILQAFTSLNSVVKESYEDLDGNGGTNTQAGFIKAEDAFSSENGARDAGNVERFVIYMTDGAAGYYYNNSGYTTGTGSPGLNPDQTAVSKSIASALSLKENTNAKIYTVALISNDVGAVQVLNPKEIINGVETNVYQEQYYKATNAAELTGIYSLLAARISEEIANNAVVTDTLPSDFTFNTSTLPQDVTIDGTGKLTWNLSTINTVEKKISIIAKYQGDNYGISYTNESCGISYNHKNTPNETTTKTFVVPVGVLAPTIELDTINVGYGGTITIDPVPSAYDNSKINAGFDKGYRVSDLTVSIYENPKNGTVKITDSNTFVYTPNVNYVGADSFKYMVTMNITNEFGTDPDKLVGTYTTIATVNVNVKEKPMYTLTLEYAYEGGETFRTDNYSYEPGKEYSIDSPKVSGWKPLTGKVAGTMPKSDVIIKIYYTRSQNILINNSMYPNKGINYALMGTAKTTYNLVNDIGYTFGFKFKAGENAPVLSFTNSGMGYTLSNFKLYEDGVTEPIDIKNSFDALDKTKIIEEKTYTVTYNLLFTNNGNITVALTNDNMMINAGVSNEISVTSSAMPLLQ